MHLSTIKTSLHPAIVAALAPRYRVERSVAGWLLIVSSMTEPANVGSMTPDNDVAAVASGDVVSSDDSSVHIPNIPETRKTS